MTGQVAAGVLAAPFAAPSARKVPGRPLTVLVGAVMVLRSLRRAPQAS